MCKERKELSPADHLSTGTPQLWRVLLLIIGLPASGKSSFLRALAEHCKAAATSASPTSNIRLEWLESFQLDNFLYHQSYHGTSDAPAKEDSAACVDSSRSEVDFTPERWKEASEAMFQAVRDVLSSVPPSTHEWAPATAAGVVVQLIAVEDVMHYRSMRERYFTLCRQQFVQQSPSSEPPSPPLVLAEVRLTASLEACIARNALRHPSLRVSSTIIRSLHEKFEYCLVQEEDTVAKNATSSFCPPVVPSVRSASVFSLVSTTCNWLVWEVHPVQQSKRNLQWPKPEALARDFVYQLWGSESQATHSLLEAQYHRLCLRHMRCMEEEKRKKGVGNASSLNPSGASPLPASNSLFHQFDQQLRRITGEWMKQHQAQAHPSASKLKKKYLNKYRETLQKEDQMKKDEGSLETQLLSQFTAELEKLFSSE